MISHCLQQGIKRSTLWKPQSVSILRATSTHLLRHLYRSKRFGRSHRYEKSDLGWPSLNKGKGGKIRLKMFLWTLQYWRQKDRVKNTLWQLLCFQLQTERTRITLPVSRVWNKPCFTTTPQALPSRKGSDHCPAPGTLVLWERGTIPCFLGENLGASFQTDVRVSRAGAPLHPRHPTGIG